MAGPGTIVNWDSRFMHLCSYIARWSKDPHYQYGAIIVGERKRIISIGYNGFPRGLNDSEITRYQEPDDKWWLEHAERNAIYNAVEPLVQCTIYVNGPPCADCARAIIQTGISRVVISGSPLKRPYKKRRVESNKAAVQMLGEANIAMFIL